MCSNPGQVCHKWRNNFVLQPLNQERPLLFNPRCHLMFRWNAGRPAVLLFKWRISLRAKKALLDIWERFYTFLHCDGTVTAYIMVCFKRLQLEPRQRGDKKYRSMYGLGVEGWGISEWGGCVWCARQVWAIPLYGRRLILICKALCVPLYMKSAL